jgi:hypothetical protein
VQQPDLVLDPYKFRVQTFDLIGMFCALAPCRFQVKRRNPDPFE